MTEEWKRRWGTRYLQGTDLDAAGAFCRLKDAVQDVCCIAPAHEQRAAAQMIQQPEAGFPTPEFFLGLIPSGHLK